MTDKQPEALRLARYLEIPYASPTRLEAAAELRRQHALIAELVQALKAAEACLYWHQKPIDPAITAALSKAEEQQ